MYQRSRFFLIQIAEFHFWVNYPFIVSVNIHYIRIKIYYYNALQ